ncbi:natriuretic peptides A-like [Python bivittatus]|uniref:Natriuretic peptides A-like n=1 Tax=Python bivittatus TaxID=176946 RepID=A0A9F5JDM0_PYTBI|nr:natriuretic peptides A-like [Python bivittatus]
MPSRMDRLGLTYSLTLLVVFLPAGPGSAHPVTGGPSGQDVRALQHLLDRLREKLQQGELELADYEAGGANDDDSYPDLGDSEMTPSQEPKLQDPLFQGEMEAQWRKFLVASRRYFSGCFGIRLDRIGTQTGLGCKTYKPRSWRRPRS